tara:strand:+ start:325 stop:564 length:240 start_codon:yes stop_codon:yes gene_type:complete
MTMSEPTKKLRPYVVRVRTLGEWWDEYEVQAENSSEAWDNWSDGDKINDDPIGLDGLEFEVDDVKPDFYEDDEDYYDDE